MYASFIETNMKPGTSAEGTEMAESMKSDLAQVDGLRQFIMIDKGDDNSVVIALYDSAEDQVAAGPQAAELLSRFAGLLAEPPERNQVEVPINFIF